MMSRRGRRRGGNSSTTYEYDASGNLTQISTDSDGDGTPDDIEAFEYNADGKLTQMSSDGDGDGILDRITTYIYGEAPEPIETDPLTGMDDNIYRFYNAVTGVHFYTSNAAERDIVINNLPGYTYEGIAGNVQNEPPVEDSLLNPLYRFYNTAVGTHFYTSNEAEKEAVMANLPQYEFEGTAFYVLGATADSGQSMYRFFNTVTGAHFYTANVAERDAVMANLPQFSYEGEAFEIA
jgi:YD repeat-containing protein